MSLVAILLSLTLIKLLPALDNWRSLAWFRSYRNWMERQLGQHLPSLGLLLLTLALPVTLLGLLQAWAGHWFFYLLLSLVVLIYCFGPVDLHRAIHHILDARDRQDTEAENSGVAALIPGITEQDLPISLRCLTEEIFIQTHERTLAIIFWFAVLGPLGALLYQLSAEWTRHSKESEDSDLNQSVKLLHTILSWAPVRLAALSYAIVGSFVHALQAWNERCLTCNQLPDCECYDIMVRIGLGSLQRHSDEAMEFSTQTVREALGLCGRALMAWITVLAVLTLAGLTI